MNAPTWLDLAPARGGLLAALLVAVVGAIVWLIERHRDVRANRRALRRRQILRRLPPTKSPAALAARTGVVEPRVGSYPTPETIHERPRERHQ